MTADLRPPWNGVTATDRRTSRNGAWANGRTIDERTVGVALALTRLVRGDAESLTHRERRHPLRTTRR